LKGDQFSGKNDLWLVHLVQLKKLFLKLSSFVELYLRQDWSLLPVPDFRSIAKGEVAEPSTLGQLNFVVAAVLVTILHSSGVEADRPGIGRAQKLVAGALDCLTQDKKNIIEHVQDWFLTALEPKAMSNSNRNSNSHSPRKLSAHRPLLTKPLNSSLDHPLNSSFNHPLNSSFNHPFNSSFNHPSNSPLDRPFNSPLDRPLFNHPATTKAPHAHPTPPLPPADIHLNTINVAKEDFELNASLAEEHESLLKETDRLVLSDGELDRLRLSLQLKEEQVGILQEAKRDLLQQLQDEQRLNRLHQDRDILLQETNDSLSHLQTQLKASQADCKATAEQLERERNERHTRTIHFSTERQLLEKRAAHLASSLREKEDAITQLQESLASQTEATKTATDEISRIRSQNDRLLACLKKARHHILKQSHLIGELQQAHALERSEINSTLVDLGTEIQLHNFATPK